jgi:hypothetical protein
MVKKRPKKTLQVKPNQDGIIRANINRQVEESPTFASLYANDTQLQITAWDVRMIFGVIVDSPTTERQTVLVRTLGEVRMSPQHAKKVSMILTQQLKRYEENIGPIALPPD